MFHIWDIEKDKFTSYTYFFVVIYYYLEIVYIQPKMCLSLDDKKHKLNHLDFLYLTTI